MKHFTLLSFAICMVALGSAVAQEGRAPQKETVIVGKFTATGTINQSNTQEIRRSVITGFVNKNRFNVIDEETDADLIKRRADVVIEDDVDATNVLSKSVTEMYSSRGAKYLVRGTASAYTSKTEQATDIITKKPYTRYITGMTFTLTGYSILTSQAIASQSITVSGSGDSRDKADLAAIKDVVSQMNTFVNDNFKFTTYILQLESVKKGKLKELYIHCGTDMGVIKGDTFIVVQESSIAGIKKTEKIGRLRAIEVNGAELTKCTVTQGNTEIEKAFHDNPESLIVISDRDSILPVF